MQATLLGLIKGEGKVKGVTTSLILYYILSSFQWSASTTMKINVRQVG